MAMFELQGPDGATYEVNAPNEAAAVGAFKKMQGPQVGQVEDIAKGLGSGFVRLGLGGLGGLPGDIEQLGGIASKWLREKVRGPDSPEQSLTPPRKRTFATSEEISKNILTPILGEEYQPQTIAGKMAKTVGGFIPAAVLGPGSVARNIGAYALAPGIASEAAGQATEGTTYEGAARIGGALAGGGLASVPARMIASSQARKTIPTTEMLKQQAQDAYKASEQAGVIIKPDSYKTMVQDVGTTISNAGAHPSLHQGALAAFKSMVEVSGQPVTLKSLDTLRQVVKDVAGSTAAGERRIAKIMSGKIDDFARNLSEKDILASAGSPQAAVKSLQDARSLWSRKSKSELVGRLYEKAKTNADQYSQSGMENALRLQFKQLANNEKKMRMFTTAEQDAIKKAARAGSTQRIMRLVGKLAVRGPVSLLPHIGLGAAAGGGLPGLIVAGAMAGLGEAGKAAASSIRMKRLRAVDDLIRSGGNLPSKKITFDAKRAALIQSLLAPRALTSE